MSDGGRAKRAKMDSAEQTDMPEIKQEPGNEPINMPAPVPNPPPTQLTAPPGTTMIIPTPTGVLIARPTAVSTARPTAGQIAVSTTGQIAVSTAGSIAVSTAGPYPGPVVGPYPGSIRRRGVIRVHNQTQTTIQGLTGSKTNSQTQTNAKVNMQTQTSPVSAHDCDNLDEEARFHAEFQAHARVAHVNAIRQRRIAEAERQRMIDEKYRLQVHLLREQVREAKAKADLAELRLCQSYPR